MRCLCVFLILFAFQINCRHRVHTISHTPEEVRRLVIEIEVTGQNRNRTVDGEIDVECGLPREVHTKPFGNWGVKSNYAEPNDRSQFRGWKDEGDGPDKLHWNSCTLKDGEFPPGDCAHYNDGDCTTQRSDSVVIHGSKIEEVSFPCPRPGKLGLILPKGALIMRHYSFVESNYMTLFELDPVLFRMGDHDLIKTIRFPDTSVTFTDCTEDGCSEQVTKWKDKIGQDDDGQLGAVVGAQLRMKVKATVTAPCDPVKPDVVKWAGKGH